MAGQNDYYQQDVDIEIHVILDDKNHQLIGKEKITYKNNSKDELEYIILHLWPNAYKEIDTELGKQLLENRQTNFYFSKEAYRGYIDDLNFKVDGKKVSWVFSGDNIDIAKVYLEEPLKPGGTVEITTPFTVKIPVGIYSRLGHIGQQYQITQWYPKPAVYDKAGWHPMPYLSQGEFYSEFGTHDVYITLPKNYVVGATGDLVNGTEEIKWLNKRVALTDSIVSLDSIVIEHQEIPSDAETKTLHYHQENVHDFAWFADKNYYVLKSQVELPHTKRKVDTWVMFNATRMDLWKDATTYVDQALYYYSLWNGDYPYNHCTAVDGSISAGGGMEYPNITVINTPMDAIDLETVIVHEVGHNWFYGILGSNERDHAWMDEGINSFYEMRYINMLHSDANYFGEDSTTRSIMKLFGLDRVTNEYANRVSYEYMSNTNNDQPISTPSAEFSPSNYGVIVYGKAAVAFNNLMGYLGEEKFDKCMREYYTKWKFKHPQPEDLKHVLESCSGTNLDWFFKDLIGTRQARDLKLLSLKADTADKTNMLLRVKQKGDLIAPFPVSAIKGDSVLFTKWYEPNADRVRVLDFPSGEYDEVRIDHTKHTFDMNRQNNTLKVKSLFKKFEPPKLQLLFSPEDGNKTELYFLPLVGWNKQDEWMLGMSLFNSSIPMKKFEYVLSPMYGTHSKTLTGFASVGRSWYPKEGFLREVRAQVNTQRFSYIDFGTPAQYYKVAPEIEFFVKRKNIRKQVDMSFKLRSILIHEDEAILGTDANSVFRNANDYYINELSFILNGSLPVNPYHVKVNVEQGEQFVKLGARANMRFSYKEPGKGFNVKFYTGRYLYNDSADAIYNFGVAGANDYKYDHLFFGRNTMRPDITAQQFIDEEGTMKHLSGFAPPGGAGVQNPNRWLTTVSVSSTIPKVPLSLYVDAGIAGYEVVQSGDLVDETSEPFWDMGVSLDLIPGSCHVYFPIAFSHDLNQLRYVDKIRFVLDMRIANIHKLKRNFLF